MKRLLFLLLLTGCDRIKQGEVFRKEYEPASTTFIMLPVIIPSGKTTTTILVPYWIYDDEDYILSIVGEDLKSKIKTRTVYVDSNTYKETNIGDTFVINKSCKLKDVDIKTKANK